MNFPQAVISGFKNYSRSTGRASRSEYWYWVLFCNLADFLAGLLDKIIFHVPFNKGPIYTHPISFVFFLIIFVPSIAIAFRRLHDVNRSGKWILIAITVIGLIYPLLIWNCKKGTVGPNRFGADPLSLQQH